MNFPYLLASVLSKKFLLLIIFIGFYLLSYSQDKRYSDGCFFCTNRDWAVSVAGHYQPFSNEISLVRTSLMRPYKEMPSDGQYILKFLAFYYSKIGIETSYNSYFQVAPKFGIGGNIAFFNANLSYILFNDRFKTYSSGILPEIGFSLAGMVHINYSYNFLLGSDQLSGITPTHRLTIRIIYFYSEWKDYSSDN